jgi:hypothetical protein
VRSGAVLEASTLIAGLDDVAVVGETMDVKLNPHHTHPQKQHHPIAILTKDESAAPRARRESGRDLFRNRGRSLGYSKAQMVRPVWFIG